MVKKNDCYGRYFTAKLDSLKQGAVFMNKAGGNLNAFSQIGDSATAYWCR
jgi:hypothetical protein